MLKPLAEIFEPDSRHGAIAGIDPNTGGVIPVTLEKYHQKIHEIRITGSPPEKVQKIFEIARNLFLYSWFVYEFTTPAQVQAYSSVEFALRERLKFEDGRLPKYCNIKKLLTEAIEREWISDDGFSHARRQRGEYDPGYWALLGITKPAMEEDDSQRYCHILLNTMPKIRNHLAHGSSHLDFPGGALLVLEICADIINQVNQ